MRWERLPETVAAWIAAGNEPPDAGAIKAMLKERGVEAEVSVMRDGTIAVESDATVQKLRPAIDAVDPAAPDPETTKRATILAAMRSGLAEMRAVPANERTSMATVLLGIAALLDLDETPVVGTG